MVDRGRSRRRPHHRWLPGRADARRANRWHRHPDGACASGRCARGRPHDRRAAAGPLGRPGGAGDRGSASDSEHHGYRDARQTRRRGRRIRLERTGGEARPGEVGTGAGRAGDHEAARGYRGAARAGAGGAAHGTLRRPARRSGCPGQCPGQRAGRRHRGQEECADPRGGEGPARPAPIRPHVSRDHGSRLAGRAPGKAKQGAAGEGDGAAQHRSDAHPRAVRRSGCGEGQRYERGRVDRDGCSGIPRGRHRVARTAGRRGTPRIGSGTRGEGHRVRSRAPERGAEGRRRHSRGAGGQPAGDDQDGGGRQPPRDLGLGLDTDVRRQPPGHRQRREPAPGLDDAGACDRRPDQGRPVSSPSGALRTGRQTGRVRAPGPLLRTATSQALRSYRDPHRRGRSPRSAPKSRCATRLRRTRRAVRVRGRCSQAGSS